MHAVTVALDARPESVVAQTVVRVEEKLVAQPSDIWGVTEELLEVVVVLA